MDPLKTKLDKIKADNDNTENEIAQMAMELEKANAEIENTYHKLFFLNSEIETFEGFFMQKQKDQEQTTKQKVEQQRQVFAKFTEATDKKVRITFQNFFLMKQQEEILQANKQSAIKMEVSACCVFYIRENPWQYVLSQQKLQEKIGEETFQLPFYCQTFSLKKSTTIDEIFQQACQFWVLRVQDHTMGDQKFNCLDMLIQNTVLAESYFAAQKESCPYAYFFLWEKRIHVSYLMDEQKQSGNKGGEDENLKKLNKDIQQLCIIKPGLKLYVNETEEEIEEPVANPDEAENQNTKKLKDTGKIGITTRLFVMALNIVLLTFLIMTGLGAYDYEKMTYLKQSLTSYIIQDGQADNLEDIYVRMKYLTVVYRRNYDQFDTVANTSEPVLKSNDSVYQDRLRFQFLSMVGPIRFLQVRSAEFDCDDQALLFNKTTCIYPIYSPANQLTSVLKNKLDPKSVESWQIFRSKEFTKIPQFNGLISSYDGSGYVYDIDSYSWVDNQIDTLNQEGLIDLLQTQMSLLDMLFYDINRDLSICVQNIFEITTSAQLSQSIIMKIYIYNQYSDGTAKNNLEFALVALGMIMCVFQIYLDVQETKNMMIIRWKKEDRDEEFSYRKHYKSIISFTGIYNLLVGILVFVQFILYFSHPSESMYDVLNHFNRKLQATQVQQDFMSYGMKFETALRIKALLIILVSFNVLVQIKTSRCLVLIILMFQRSFEQILIIMIFFVCLMISFSVVYFWTYGQELYEFNYFGRALLSFWDIFVFGNQDLWKRCQQIDPTVNASFTVIVFVTISYGTLMIINAVMQENYRLIRFITQSIRSYRNDDVKEVNMYYQQLDYSYQNTKKQIKDFIDKQRRRFRS